MKINPPKLNRLLLALNVLLFISIMITSAIWMEQNWFDPMDDKWKEDVEGVIWAKRTGSLTPNYFYIVDTDDLYCGDNGWQYNVSIHIDSIHPGENAIDTSIWPDGERYLPGKHWKEYDEGDYFKGKLERWSYDPGPNMSSLVSFYFCLAIIVGVLGRVMFILKGNEHDFFRIDNDS